MRQHIFQCNRFAEGFGNFEIEIFINVFVEVEFALFDKLHHRRPGE